MSKQRTFTLSDLRNTAAAKRNPHLFREPEKKKKLHVEKKRSAAKEWLALNLGYWCNERSLELKEEYRFDEYRKWRFDWAIPALNLAIEYEGLFSEKSRHTTIKGFNGDVEKYNHATMKGWKVIRLTATNYKEVLEILNRMG
jgi:hypothetical protein